MTLPPIRDWWPQLSIDARRTLLDGDLPHLTDAVREEIREITGAVVGMQETLSDEDLDYARAEVEASGE
ncbi:hypothetical protein [Microbacterium galbinum]|uniref:Uncharacterized protein n=1 Tax=Microbacterium galbinum TaxID=2851646 RepID=A0ABY4IUF4_9MICO|nr:hypothetical protein [Microbacterium galbinum]MCK2029080.1 hypothetical protein [Microbacterium galbinum]UPL15128.1 hypothetical protein KV396_11845 [Microbacterium galbinum]